MEDGASLSSSDHALRYRAPSCVAARWRVTEAYNLDPAEKLKRRFAFVDTSIRYLVAALASEHAARGLPAVPSWERLRLAVGERPLTLGSWRDAARDLSRAVLEGPDCILRDVAGVLANDEGGRVGLTAGSHALDRIIALRNREAHPDQLVASEASLEELEADFRAWLAALRAIGKQPPWVLLKTSTPDGDLVGELQCLRGIEPAPPVKVHLRAPLRDGVPFILSRRGDALYLGPMLRWAQFRGSVHGPELLLFLDWKKGPRFADPRGMADAEVRVDEGGESPQAWLGSAGIFGIKTDFLHAHTGDRERLLDPDRLESRPEVPGHHIGARLGHGGNGRVYLATDPSGRTVAVKVLADALTADPTARERLRREYTSMQRVRHPNVADVYALLDSPSGPVLVMEYIPGQDLRTHLAAGPLPLDRAVAVAEQVAAGLAAAHAARVVHRDVTPENVIIDATGAARLIDFGIARVVGDSHLTRTVDGLGKLHFAAPEQIASPSTAGAPADVFAVGRLLGWMVTAADDPAAQLAALPGALQAVVRTATDPEPARRFPGARELLDTLRGARQAGWRGAPVRPGDALSPEVKVGARLGSAATGLWLLEAEDSLHGERVLCVVAERRPGAEEALRERMARLRLADREALGFPELRETRDGLRWTLLRRPDVERARAYFGMEAVSGREGVGGALPTATPVEVELEEDEVEEDDLEMELEPEPAPAATSQPPPRPGPRPRPERAPPASAIESPGDWRPTPPPGFHGGTALGISALSLLAATAFPPAALGVAAAALQYGASGTLKAPPGGPRPPYLPAIPAVVRQLPPARIARHLDDLALLVFAQREATGTPLLPGWEDLQAHALRPAWTVVTMPLEGHLPAHRQQFAGAGAVRRAWEGVCHLHSHLRDPALTPHWGAVDIAYMLLHRMVHAGGEDVEPGRFAHRLRLVGGSWRLRDIRVPGGWRPLLDGA